MPRSKNEGEGTPAKLTRRLIDDICKTVETGVYIETAAAYAGVHRSTFYDWLKFGRKHIETGKRSVYRELVQAVDVAVAKFEVGAMARLQEAGGKVWQADAWRLERRLPDRYQRRRIEHTGPEGGPIQMRIDISKLSDEELDQLEQLIEKGRGDD